MTRSHYPYVVLGFVAIAAFAALAIWGIPYFLTPVQISGHTSTFGSQTARARVSQILDEGQIELNGKNQLYQVMRVVIQEGEFQGIPFQIDYGKRTLRSDNFRFSPGDQVYVALSRAPDNVINAYYDDYVRTRPLAILFAAFVVSILILG
jgi:uncharacterized membrane protein